MAPVICLFLLAPFVGEYLLGNLTFAELWLGFILAPLYGCGALLARELGRRAGGWPSIFLFGAVHALIEEGPVDQLLWNDSYAGQDLLHGPSYLPFLGMSVELTQAILALHTIWSICVPIALVETAFRSTEPWLRTRGVVTVGVLYAIGATLVFLGNYSEEHFLASPAQLIGITVVIVLLVVLAFRVRLTGSVPGKAPSPWAVGVVSLAGTSLYWGPSVLITDQWFEWVGVAVWFVLVALGIWLVARWSRQDGWGQWHRYALAAGAVLTYIWSAFPTKPEGGGPDFVSDVVFGVLGLIVLAGSALGLRRKTRS